MSEQMHLSCCITNNPQIQCLKQHDRLAGVGRSSLGLPGKLCLYQWIWQCLDTCSLGSGLFYLGPKMLPGNMVIGEVQKFKPNYTNPIQVRRYAPPTMRPEQVIMAKINFNRWEFKLPHWRWGKGWLWIFLNNNLLQFPVRWFNLAKIQI